MNKPIWLKSSPEQKTVLIVVLMLANHEQSEWEWMGNKFKVEPGQFITSLESLKEYCGRGVSTQNIRSALGRFEKLEFLTNKSTKTGRLITICNWDDYQITKEEHNKEANKQVTKNQQTGNKEVTPTKNIKKKKNNNNERNKKIIYPFDEDEFIAVWEFWKEYKKEQHGFTYKQIGEQGALGKLVELSGGKVETAMLIIKQSIQNSWKGLFELKGEFKTQEYDRGKIFDDLAKS